MHADYRLDQAEGLRRLLERSNARTITLVSGKSGSGRTSVAINLATALTLAGKHVMLIDGNQGKNNLVSQLGLRAEFDLLDVLQGRCTVGEVCLVTQGLSVLPAMRAMCALDSLNAAERQQLARILDGVSSECDVMLVDAAMPVLCNREASSERVGVAPNLSGGNSLLLVVDATSDGITDSYALIKKLVLENVGFQFGVVVNKVAHERMARAIFNNMANVARDNLAIRLDYFGYIPPDRRLSRTDQIGQAMVKAFPQSVSARAFLELSQKLLVTTDDRFGPSAAHTLTRKYSRPHDVKPTRVLSI